MDKPKLFHKDFTLVVMGQIISLFGNGILRFALPLHLLNQTGSSTLFGLVSALSLIPIIMLMPIGGILADRVNKRNIMVGLDVTTAALMLLFFFLFGKVDLVLLLLITMVLLYGIQGVYQPAVQASMPLLHKEQNLLPANAIINQISSLSSLLAPAIGGILYGSWGLTPIIIVSGACFLFSAIMEIFIQIPHSKISGKQGVFQMVRQDMSHSLIFICKQKSVLLKSIGITCAFNLFLSSLIMVSMPVLITQKLGMSDQLYGYSQGALAAGGLMGGLLLHIFAKKLKITKLYVIFFTVSMLLLPMVAALWMGITPFNNYLVICISCFLLMAVATMGQVQLLTFVQQETPVALGGKVIAWVMALSMCSQPIGQAIYGYLFDILERMPHVIILGAAILSSLTAIVSKKVFQDIKI